MMRRIAGVNLILRFFIGALYCYAGMLKLLEPVENFRGAIADYGLFAPWMNAAAAHLIPWLELLCGLGLLSGYFLRLNALVLSLLSLSFVGMITASFLVHGKVPGSCGCFGAGIHLSPWQVIALDLFNFAAGLRLFFEKEHSWSLDSWASRR